MILSRRVDEEIVIDGPCRIRIVETKNGRVRIGLMADRSVAIVRAELLDEGGQLGEGKLDGGGTEAAEGVRDEPA